MKKKINVSAFEILKKESILVQKMGECSLVDSCHYFLKSHTNRPFFFSLSLFFTESVLHPRCVLHCLVLSEVGQRPVGYLSPISGGCV